MSTTPKILLFDIENAPALGYFYDMYKEGNIVEVLETPYMLSFAYKWLGEGRVHSKALPDYPGYEEDRKNDEKLVADLATILDQADLIVAHNGDRFDLRMTNTRLITHCLPPIAPNKTIDTLKIARAKFKFLSNRLDDLGNFLNVGRKIPHIGKKLWLDCMNGDLKAWKQMRQYNAQDVVLLERVYLRLRPYASNHPNVNYFTRALDACPKCGSTILEKRGFSYNARGEAQRYFCLSCHGWSQDKYEVLDSDIRIK